jgi:hypothetical protein
LSRTPTLLFLLSSLLLLDTKALGLSCVDASSIEKDCTPTKQEKKTLHKATRR